MISKYNCKILRHAKRRTINQMLLREDTRGVSRSLCRVEKLRGMSLMRYIQMSSLSGTRTENQFITEFLALYISNNTINQSQKLTKI